MRSCKAATRKPTSRGRLAWIRRRSAESLVVTPGRAAISLQASAREGVAEAQGGLGQATQNDAGPGGADRGETDARAVESRSDQLPSGEGWRRLYQSRAHLSACLERQEDGGALHLHLRHSGKKYNKRKGKNSGRGLIPDRVDIDQRPSIVAAKRRIGYW